MWRLRIVWLVNILKKWTLRKKGLKTTLMTVLSRETFKYVCVYTYSVILLLQQLASDAGSIVAMTEDEKKRLEQLLTKSDEEEEEMSNKEVSGVTAAVCSAACCVLQEEGEATTHKMELIPVGFTFSEDDMERIRDIDRFGEN